MRRFDRVLIDVICIVFFGALSVFLQARSQEKPVRETRIWQAAELPSMDTGWVFYAQGRIDIIDTEGVCLYVVRARSNQASSPIAITAVPKTQLPQGTGCQ